MTGPEVMDVARDAIVTLILVAAPLMLVGLMVGVVVSLFQALTQIQETDAGVRPKNPGDLPRAVDRAAVHGRRAAQQFSADRRAHHQRLNSDREVAEAVRIDVSFLPALARRFPSWCSRASAPC